mgnify:CR=1 FL=1
MENLIGVALGGLIGVASAIGMEKWRESRNATTRRMQIKRLLELLYEEVEQLAELLAIDLDAGDGSLPVSGADDKAGAAQVRAAIDRLRDNRNIYESQAGKFLELPGYVPNRLVRFYTRLEVNCGRMIKALNQRDFIKIAELRDASLGEAEALKIELREAMLP